MLKEAARKLASARTETAIERRPLDWILLEVEADEWVVLRGRAVVFSEAHLAEVESETFNVRDFSVAGYIEGAAT